MNFTKNRLASMAGWLNLFCAIILIVIAAFAGPAVQASGAAAANDEVGPTTPYVPPVDQAPAENPDHFDKNTPGGGIEATIIAIVTPLLVAGIRKGLPKIPKAWLPLIASLLGAILDYGLPWLGLKATGFGFAFGFAGVGVREAQDQMRKAAKASIENLAMLAFAAGALLFGSGCARYQTIQEDSSYEKGQLSRKITTRVSAGTFISAQSELAKSTVTQTDKSQSSKVGTITQAATNSVGGIRDVVDLVNAIKTPVPVPSMGN